MDSATSHKPILVYDGDCSFCRLWIGRWRDLTADRVRYEELVTAPADVLRPLLAFAGVEWEDDLLAAIFSRRHDQGGGDPKIQFADRIETASVGSGQRINLGNIPEEMRRAADQLSARLSYPPLEAGRQLPWRPAAEPVAAGKAPASPVRQFLEEHLPEQLLARPELVEAIQGSCKLVLQGEGGGQWQLSFADGLPAVTADGGAADCSVTASVADFAAVLAGSLNPMVALWNGQITIEGDANLAAQVAQLIQTLSREAAEAIAS